MAKNKDSIPSVLSFEKKLVLSDGYMYATEWDKRTESASPLSIVEKSVRGTISNRQPDAIAEDPTKLNAKIENPNLQRIDACALPMNKDTLKLEFSIKVLSGIDTPSACNNKEFAKKYGDKVQAYVTKTSFTELAVRYAENIANARFLWRNRLGAEDIKVHVCSEDNQDSKKNKEWCFNAYDFSLKKFSGNHADVLSLGAEIASALSGKVDYKLFTVTTYVRLGKGQEVYPSEELVYKKGKEDKSKVLYAVDGIAGMHSQKISNAIRTIDTWYPDPDGVQLPIAVEPYGVVTTLGFAYRSPATKKDFYSLFDSYVLGGELSDDDEHYVMAVLVRGGIFGKGEEKKGNSKEQ